MRTISGRTIICILVALAGLASCVLVWNEVLSGAPAQGKEMGAAFGGPILLLYGTASAIFGYDRFMAFNDCRGRKEFTWAGWGLFWLGLFLAAGHFALLVHFAKNR